METTLTTVNSGLDLIGNTPLVRLNAVSDETGAEIYGKCEFMNPCGSVKDRPAKAMIEAAEKSGELTPETIIIEPTSGNTGIALAFIAAIKGYKIVITMPESMSLERRSMLQALGAQLELTPAHLQMDGAIARAEELKKEYDKAFIPQQFNNAANPEVHFKTTGPEIWAQTGGKIDVFVAAVGTGGTITGVSKYIKSQFSALRTVAVEPTDSAVLSGKDPGPHMIQGIGAGFVPNNLDRSQIDDILQVSNEDAIDMTRRLARDEGFLCGISAGANVWAASQVAARPEFKGKTIVTVLCDIGDRYLSTPLFRKEQK